MAFHRHKPETQAMRRRDAVIRRLLIRSANPTSSSASIREICEIRGP